MPLKRGDPDKMCMQQFSCDRLYAKLTLERTEQGWRVHLSSLCFPYRWFILTRKRKCRSFLSSLPITTWRPLRRSPSLISRWVTSGFKGGPLCRGHPRPRVVIASERVNFPCLHAWRYLRIDLQISWMSVRIFSRATSAFFLFVVVVAARLVLKVGNGLF